MRLLSGVALTKSTFALQRKGIKKLRVQGDSFLPTVDVLIIATGQPDQVVVDTAMAASRLDWPIDRIRVGLSKCLTLRFMAPNC